MPHLLRVTRKDDEPFDARRGFPFSVPTIASFDALDLDQGITIFVGENGTGKSTLLEAIACAAQLPTAGTMHTSSDDTLEGPRVLARELRLGWRPRSREGLFFRAEDYFGHLKQQARIDARLVREKLEARGIPLATVERPDALHHDEQEAARFLSDYDSRSHGESFMDLFSARVRPRGLYLLDEPEAALSPRRQLALLALFVERVERNAQFIIATHSPILLACPGARIYGFDNARIREATYAELDQVNLMRDFLADPNEAIRQIQERSGRGG